MDVESKLANGYRGVQGGLFSKVTKADVGDGFAAMAENRVTLMGWADPFYPDASLPGAVKEALVEAYTSGLASHYTMPIGMPELREEIARRSRVFHRLEADPKRNVMITPGSDSGLYYAMSVFLNPGDEVLVPDPSYPNNFLNPKLLGAVTVPVPLDKEHGWRLDPAAFEAAVTDRTKMVLLTHPNNPTATVFRREDLEELCRMICRRDLVLVVDQAFEDMVFDGIEFVSPASLPGMWERTITVCSVSKGMGLSGLRVGYLIACDRVMDVLYGAAVSVVGATCTASQWGALAAFRNPDFMEEYRKKYDFRRRTAFQILNQVPGVSMLLPESGFYSWVDVSRLGSSAKITEHLVACAKVAVNDGKNYGARGDGHLRIIHGCLWSDEEAMKAVERIAEALDSYRE
ncbi:pyridoxal phosphate-dependent aminotransferase [Papillibacter cinnamivorans]|uniref:Aminotransferase n=1 Tax=Papillibacter cinnamivorans DSM 12816 TaxID=1122930 RepID=A0A1W2BLB4_9FIRM|nr:pyridoxal phosphate-dependent aminotransferase [Papillibacter cinnamivorans]SMC73775.1 Aspartate/methionine/tyrosine aminotransferase [Papillibacter cinnamivorans DSM 12816]